VQSGCRSGVLGDHKIYLRVVPVTHYRHPYFSNFVYETGVTTSKSILWSPKTTPPTAALHSAAAWQTDRQTDRETDHATESSISVCLSVRLLQYVCEKLSKSPIVTASIRKKNQRVYMWYTFVGHCWLGITPCRRRVIEIDTTFKRCSASQTNFETNAQLFCKMRFPITAAVGYKSALKVVFPVSVLLLNHC